MAKIKMPTTRAGFQKRLDKLSKDGINTPEQANEYARLMLGSIDLEMGSLNEWKDHPMIQQLTEKYQDLKTRWTERLKYTEELK